ncbi:MAG: MCE family protein [Bacteroidales bacterium]|nr:MCE family protein [Bacteroidales bacterium]
MTINRNFRIGIFAICGIIVLILGMNYLRGHNAFSRGSIYYACFADVNGITDSSPIFFNGYQIGTVRSIIINTTAPSEQRFCVAMNIEKISDIPQGSVAEIFSTDLLGSRGISIVFSQSDKMHSWGDTLASFVRKDLTQQILPMKDKVEVLMVRVDSLLADMSNFFGGPNGKSLSQSIEALNATMKNFEAVSYNLSKLTAHNGMLNQVLESADSTFAIINSQTNEIDTIFTHFANIATNLDAAMPAMQAALDGIENVVNQLDSAQGSLGMLLSDAELYNNLNESAVNLNRLMTDIRINPGRYVNLSAFKFGKNVYFASPDAASFVGLIYTVRIAQSKTPLNIDSRIEGHSVIEHYTGRRYNYLLGTYATRKEAEDLQKSIIAKYPDSEIVSYNNGKEIE